MNYIDRPNIVRPYTREQVRKLQGTFTEDYRYAKEMTRKLRHLFETEKYIHTLGAVTGNQAMQMAKAGLKAIYCSGWQVAADNNLSGQMYPDQSLYPCNSVPDLVKRINNTLKRADQIDYSEGKVFDYFLPIIADAEAGYGGSLNAFELMKAMIEAGAAAVHFEDQLSSAKKCGHLGGKVLIPASQFIQTLIAARLASDVMGVDTLIIARTDANSAKLLTTDIDDQDAQFIKVHKLNTKEIPEEALSVREYTNKYPYIFSRTSEGFYEITGGIEMAINRGLQYAPYADLLWCETSSPDLDEAKEFADKIHAKFPGKWLAYNCSPSFNWGSKFSTKAAMDFQDKLGDMGYKFQFVTLAGFHTLNHAMFELAASYKVQGMCSYMLHQEMEMDQEPRGYTAIRHQHEVGVDYYDLIAETISNGKTSTLSKESTEKEQFLK